MQSFKAIGLGWAAAVCAIALAAGVAPPAVAQAGPSAVPAQQEIHDLKVRFGVMIIARSGVDLNESIDTGPIVNAATANQAVSRLAQALEARARKIFIVEPATTDRPVTTFSDARDFEGATGYVTLDLTGLPAADAVRAVAGADNAGIDLRSDVGSRTVNLSGSNLTMALAIAQIAAQTQTHWIQAYEIVPEETPTTFVRVRPYQQTYPTVGTSVDQGPMGPVFFHPAPPQAPAKVATTTAPTSSDQAAGAEAGANAASTESANQTNPYAPPYFVTQNGYAYTPGGYPYATSTYGYSNGGYSVSPGVYVMSPYDPPIIAGGTNTTAGY